MAHLLKRFFLFIALFVGAWIFVYAITRFVALSPKTQFAVQQYAVVTALVVFIFIVGYKRIKMRR